MVDDITSDAVAEGRQRAGWQPRHWLVGLLAAALGFALVVQVRSTQDDGALASARTSDLVRMLDDLGERAERLEVESRRLEATREQLVTGADRRAVARDATLEQLRTLEVLAGTVPVRGPGIELVVIDRAGVVDAAELLDAVQELRDAGAEAIEVDGVRWVAGSYVLDTEDGLSVDGVDVAAPYEVRAVGDAATLASALAIPGGLIASLRDRGADVLVEQRREVTIGSLKPVEEPQYARPAENSP